MHDFQDVLAYLATPRPLLLMMLGTALGVVVGAMPGLTGSMLIALTLPLTFYMNYAGGNLDALVLLVSMYVGSISGGLISATLLRMPGTPASMMTTLDGYPMARSGRPGRALGLGITASFVGGMISWLFLLVLARPMADLSTKLGNFELFSLVLMALVLIASVSGKDLARGFIAGFLGILATFPGTSPATGQVRLTLGIPELNAGLDLLPVLIGLLAVSQIIKDIVRINEKPHAAPVGFRGIFMTLQDWKNQAINLIRSSVIGTWIGLLPGVGANIGSLMAYSAAKNFSKKPEQFGQGAEEGIVASEAANNATVGGALIPLISLGIPGSVIDAILLGALTLHNLQPGPLLYKSNPEVVHTIIITMLAANIFMFLFMVATTPLLSKLLYVPRWILMPIILVFCVVGTLARNNRIFDVWVMIGFGILGYVMERLRLPLAPFVIGFVLAPIAEKHLSAGLMQSGGSYLPIVTSPISLVFFLIAVSLLIWPLWRRWQEQQRERTSK